MNDKETRLETTTRLGEPSGVKYSDPVSLLGEVTAAFGQCEFSEALAVALDLVREAVEGDDAELFFSEPEGRDLLLTSCRGDDVEVLVERTRFEPGRGFPGRVTTSGRPRLSRNLAGESEYLRRSVVRRGIDACVCVPLRAPRGLKGTLNAVWRQPPESLEERRYLMETAGSLISTHLAARFSRLRSLVDRLMESVRNQPLQTRVEAVVKLVVQLSGARRAVAKVDLDEETELRVRVGISSKPDADTEAHHCRCALIEEGHGDFGGAYASTSRECPLVASLERCCRLPMVYEGEDVGCIVVEFDGDVQKPTNPELLPLLIVARQSARHLNRRREENLPPAVVTGDRPQTPTLEVHGLGPLQLKKEGTPVEPADFDRSASLDLLRILALQAGRPLSRDQLVEKLWPETDPNAGKNRLHVALHGLRSVLEPEGRRGEWRLVRTRRDQYLLDDEELWTDFGAFEERWSRIQRLRTGATRERSVLLERMLELYRGDLFGECRYRDWCESRRIYLRRLFVEATETYVDFCIENGDFEAALERLRRGLEVDEWNDTFNRRLVEVMLASGRRRVARDHYQRYVEGLREKLDCEPMPETRRLDDLLELARDDFDEARSRLGLTS